MDDALAELETPGPSTTDRNLSYRFAPADARAGHWQDGVKVLPELSNNKSDHGSHVEESRLDYLAQRPQDLLGSQ